MQTDIPGVDLQFFPEGGYLINGVRSRVAFKALKPDGLGIDAKGTVTDNTGTVIADFSSEHLGMGVFALQPEAGKLTRLISLSLMAHKAVWTCQRRATKVSTYR